MNVWYARAIALAAVLAGHGAAVAHAMTDPTRPAHALAASEGELEPARARVLQSVMILPHRRSAIIDGTRVEAGGKYGDAEVLKITETEVVLRRGGRVETLRMYPDIEKKTVIHTESGAGKGQTMRSRP